MNGLPSLIQARSQSVKFTPKQSETFGNGDELLVHLSFGGLNFQHAFQTVTVDRRLRTSLCVT